MRGVLCSHFSDYLAYFTLWNLSVLKDSAACATPKITATFAGGIYIPVRNKIEFANQIVPSRGSMSSRASSIVTCVYALTTLLSKKNNLHLQNGRDEFAPGSNHFELFVIQLLPPRNSYSEQGASKPFKFIFSQLFARGHLPNL